MGASACRRTHFDGFVEHLLESENYVGSVAERLNAPVLKTGVGLYPTVSSNLTASARFHPGNSLRYRDFFRGFSWISNRPKDSTPNFFRTACASSRRDLLQVLRASAS